MIALHHIYKSYQEDHTKVNEVLKDLNLEIKEGEKVIITGDSGSGKSTLLNIIAFLDFDFKGDYTFQKQSTENLKKDISRIRNEEFGFIFQDCILIEHASVYENVVVPLLYSKNVKKSARKQKIMDVLNKVDLLDKIDMNVSKLSGGERQRVSIARAIVNDPNIIVLDEPTRGLNKELATSIMGYIYQYVNEEHKTMIMVTHDIDKDKQGLCRVIKLNNGRIESDITY